MQLMILYKQVIKTTKKRRERENMKIKDIFDSSYKVLKNLFDVVLVFINTDKYQRKMELEKIQEQLGKLPEDHINADNFAEEWEKLMEILPDTYIVEDTSNDDFFKSKERHDPELDNLIAGWINKSKKNKYLRGDE